MIPIFEDGMNVALVERKDVPGLLGVAVRGGRFVVPLPLGYDGQTSVVRVPNGTIIVAHPALPALICDPTTGKYTMIHDTGHIDAVPGKFRLN